MENIFFDLNKLKHCGKNVIFGKTERIRNPELFKNSRNIILCGFGVGLSMSICNIVKN